jgi:DNA-directed RNA polymerase specialized sigma24 family protein
MLGSVSEAEDAAQEAWLRASRADIVTHADGLLATDEQQAYRLGLAEGQLLTAA